MNMKDIIYQNQYQRRGTLIVCLFFVCLILSVTIHIFLFKKIEKLELSIFDPSSFDNTVPRRFHLESVKIDSTILEERKDKLLDPFQSSLDVTLEKSEMDFAQNNLNNTVDKPLLIDENQILEEMPDIFIKSNIINRSQQDNEKLFSSYPNMQNDVLGDLTNNQKYQGNRYSELDQLIEEKNPLSSKTSPILLPTDLLFEYNADQLKVDAEKSLKKLALLIERNPKAQFIVEGYTDSFGSDEYNLDLSNRRASTIKDWLIKKEHIDPKQVDSYGLGKTHFIVPNTGTINEQSLNRRVEIVIRQNKNP